MYRSKAYRRADSFKRKMHWIFHNQIGTSVLDDGVHDERPIRRTKSSDLGRLDKNGNEGYGLAKQNLR